MPTAAKHSKITKETAYPFGMLERSYSDSIYRFGFNTQEKVPELGKNHYTALFWEYDSRLARRWNLDPKPQIFISDYAVLGNSPLFNTDVLGDIVKYGRVGANRKERRQVKRDIRRNKRFDPEFKRQIKQEKKDKSKIYRYIRTADKSVQAILPSQSESKEWSPLRGDALPVETKRYNPTGNNIKRLNIPFIGNTNSEKNIGNVSVIAMQYNDLFRLNKKVNIFLKGSTPAPASSKNLTPSQEGSTQNYTIDGVTSPSFTLHDLLNGRATRAKELLINNGLNHKFINRVKVSKSHIYNSTVGVVSAPQIKK